jgi:hypothetical protein
VCCSRKVHSLYIAAPTPRKAPWQRSRNAFRSCQSIFRAADLVSEWLWCPVEWLIGSGRIATSIEWLPTANILSAIISIEGKEGTSRSREEQEIIYFFLYFLHTICTFFIIVLENKRKIILISPICLSSSSVILLLVCDLLSQRMLNYLFVIPEMRNVGNSSSLNSGGRFQHFI